MENIICDTMIWYYLGNKIFEFPKRKVNLIGTSVSIRELGTTPNLNKKKIHLVQNAAKAFLLFPKHVIKTNPLDYIIKHFFNDFNIHHDVEENLIKGFERLAIMDLQSISNSTFEEIKRQIDEIRIPQRNYINKINSEIIPKRNEHVKNNTTAKQLRKTDISFLVKDYFCDLIYEFSKTTFNKKYKIDPLDERWNHFKTFTLAWEVYHKEIDIGSEKLKENDWVDLFNLVYVNSNFKYWTIDQKILRILNLNTELKNIIYTPI